MQSLAAKNRLHKKGNYKLVGLTAAAKECGVTYSHARRVLRAERNSPLEGRIREIMVREYERRQKEEQKP